MTPARPEPPADARVPRVAPKQLRVPDDVAVLVRNLHPEIKRKVREALKTILATPDTDKLLREELGGSGSTRTLSAASDRDREPGRPA